MSNISEVNLTDEQCAYYDCMDYPDYVDFIENYIFPRWYEWIFMLMHLLVLVVGLVGNMLVVVAVYCNRSMRTVTNLFIVNLAVADFFVILVCLPPTVLWDVTETWFFGKHLCRIVLYFQVRFFSLKTLPKMFHIQYAKLLKSHFEN